MFERGVRACGPLLLVVIAACEARKTPPAVPVYGERDSASVHITADSAPAWTDADRWTVDPTPTLDIGTLDGNPMYEFAEARKPVRLSDGRIVVDNMKTTEIRFFSPEGVFLKSIGHLGQGPGEFEQIWDMRKIAGDSIMALEPPNTTTIFTPSGDFARRFRLERGPPGYSNIWWLGRLDGGYLVAVALARFGTRPLSADEQKATGESGGVKAPKRPRGYRDSLTHFLYTMDGRRVDSIATFPGQHLSDGEYPPETAYAVDGPRFYYSPGDRIEIREFTLVDSASSPRLRVTRIIRLPPHRRAVTAADKEFVLGPRRESLRKRTTWSEADIARSLDRLLFFDSLPAHARHFRLDPEHNMWLRGFEPDPDAASHWFVIDSRGKWLGSVETPPRFEVNEIGADYLLGIWRDASDVQHVRMYRILKPAAKRGSR